MISICPACEALKFIPFERARYKSTDYRIIQCCGCGVLINETAYSELLVSTNEVIQKTNFYNINISQKDALYEEYNLNKKMLHHLFKLANFQPEGKVFLDFGAGRGVTSWAAAQFFSRVYAVDMDTAPSKALQVFVNENIFKCFDSIDELPEKVDFVFLWHVLEHFPNPIGIIKSFFEKVLTADGLIVLQVPLYRPKHLEHCHYLFYNENSISELFRRSGGQVSNILFDYDRSFMTCIVRSSVF